MMERERFLHRWKWVLLYTSILYGTVYFLPWIGKTLNQCGMGWIIRYGPVALILVAGGVFLERLCRPETKRKKTLLVSMTVIGAVYAWLLTTLSSFPVERAHLLEYGLLGFLVFRTLEGRHETWRLYFYSFVIVLMIGFFDEVLQGILPGRYYDVRDIGLNVVSGALGIASFALFRASFPLSSTPRLPAPWGGKKTAMDIAAVAAMAVFPLLLWRIDYVEANLDPLYGQWLRTGACGEADSLEFFTDGRFFWKDSLGHQSQGDFYLEGNRLDETKIVMVIKHTNNDTQCGVRLPKEGNRWGGRIKVKQDRLLWGRLGPWMKQP